MAVKLCKDCRWGKHDYWGLKCFNPKIAPRDLGTGERPYADSARNYSECGVEAKLFEPLPLPVPEALKPKKVKVSWYVRMLWRIDRWLESKTSKKG